MAISSEQARDLRFAASPLAYIESLGFQPYAWQRDVLRSRHKRKVINGARQAGKSTIISARPCHRAKYFPGSLSIVIAPTERQALLDIEKMHGFIALDRDYPDYKPSMDQIKVANGSRIVVAPATDAARGYSNPDIIMLDEASRIPDLILQGVIMPMLTDNDKCELILISTPNGRNGFFYRDFNNSSWERYEVRAPWDVVDLEYRLIPVEPEGVYQARLAKCDISAYYSPRHASLAEQQANLEEMGSLMYRQEYRVEFVEPEDQVFSYDDIERMLAYKADPLAMDTYEHGEALVI
jgi:hypothetical protein